jgi:hypothetical protein
MSDFDPDDFRRDGLRAAATFGCFLAFYAVFALAILMPF